MKERKKQAVCGRSAVLAVVLLGALLVSISSIALAAPAPTASQEEVTMIDPFTIRIISVSGNPVNIQAVTAAVHITPRHWVRVPVRPELRSAFQPVWW